MRRAPSVGDGAVLGRLLPGVALVALASLLLLWADMGSRRGASARAGGGKARLALVQHASLGPLDEGASGVLEALAAAGHHDGGDILLRRYNAEGDLGTANTIAREVTSGAFDVVVTLSTPSLQTVAAANRGGRPVRHVFGLTSDPFAAGVGLVRTNPSVHPPYMSGQGCMQPVASVFRVAREMRPELRRVGLAWNPAEANSASQTRLAREVCVRLGIELVEANAETSTAAVEAAASLVSRGVEAIWISGDITVATAAEGILGVATRARIPVFTCMPPLVSKGSIFDLGADYAEVGRAVGRLVAEVLSGRDLAGIPVTDLGTEKLFLNERALELLRDRWRVPPEIRARASGWIDASGTNLPVPGRTR